MSEKEPKKFEIGSGSEGSGEVIPVKHLQNQEQLSPQNETETRQKNIESARADIEKVAESGHENPLTEKALSDAKDNDIKWTSKELLAQTYDRTLSSVRNRLKKPERTFSKIIHQPVIEKGSEVLGATIARPSGILFGGLFSFVGSLLGYLLAKRLGGELPLSIFAFCFVGGFAFGLAIEFTWYFYKKRKQKIK